MKTCTTRRGGAWTCWVTRNAYASGPAGKRRALYPPDARDVLAVVDGDGGVYLIPYAEVAGQATVTLRAYERHRVARLSGCGRAPGED